MNIEELEKNIAELKQSSIASIIMITISLICLMGSFYYSATRLTPLEREVAILKDQSISLEQAVKDKEARLQATRSDLEKMEHELALNKRELSLSKEELTKSNQALTLLQEGISYLLNRQYKESIASFNKYLEHVPNSHEGLNLLGYAELRYSNDWRIKSSDKKSSTIQKEESAIKANQYSNLAEIHLSKSSELNPQYSWPNYNLAILYYQKGEKSRSLEKIESTLSLFPNMINWLCEDGQFRKLRLDDETNVEFISILTKKLGKENIDKCWVIKAPIKPHNT